jgi:spermidine synthase
MTDLIERREGPYGEVALRRRDECLEIIANGCFLMDSSDGRSERLMVSAALELLTHPEGASLLIGGLGVGFSLAEACADPRPARIEVVERERAIIDWHTQGEAPLRKFAGTGHDDPRTAVIHDDLVHHLRTVREPYDVVCLDIDNGPHWTVTEDNRSLYESAGLDLLSGALTEQGVLSVWSSARSPEFMQRLASRFALVATLEVPVLVGRGAEPDVIMLGARRYAAGRPTPRAERRPAGRE